MATFEGNDIDINMSFKHDGHIWPSF